MNSGGGRNDKPSAQLIGLRVKLSRSGAAPIWGWVGGGVQGGKSPGPSHCLSPFNQILFHYNTAACLMTTLDALKNTFCLRAAKSSGSQGRRPAKQAPGKSTALTSSTAFNKDGERPRFPFRASEHFFVWDRCWGKQFCPVGEKRGLTFRVIAC